MPKTKSGRRQPAAGAPTTRASQRAHVRASTAATKASSSTQKRAKRTTETTVTETSHEPSLPTTSTAQQEALLSPQFMETLVSRVADEVSRRLSPAETPAVIPPVVPSALNEVPVCPLANSESVGNNAVASAIVLFGFLRLGELTCNSKFSPEIHLAPRDVRFFPHQGNPDFMTLGIKASKTDPFRSGHTITIGKTGLPLCPISAMQKYLQARDTSSGPLFIYSSGTPLTKTALVSETRALLSRSGFNASHYAGHSYRIGAATTAASAGLPAWLIKTMGRWSSDCYERYVRVPHSVLSDVSKTLAKNKTKKKTHL